MKKEINVFAMSREKFDKWLQTAEETDVIMAFNEILLIIRQLDYRNLSWENKRRVILCYRKAKQFYSPTKILIAIFNCLPLAILLFFQCLVFIEKAFGVGTFGNIRWSLAFAPVFLWMLFDWILDIVGVSSK